MRYLGYPTSVAVSDGTDSRDYTIQSTVDNESWEAREWRPHLAAILCGHPPLTFGHWEWRRTRIFQSVAWAMTAGSLEGVGVR